MITTLARKGTPGFHNPDIVRRHDGKFNVWLLRPSWATQADPKTMVEDRGAQGDFSSSMKWTIIGVGSSFKDALSIAKAHR